MKNGGNLLVVGTKASILFKTELGIKSYSETTGTISYVTASGKIGSIRSDLLHVELDDAGKTLSKFYKGSDFNYPEEAPAASIHPFGKGKVAGIYFNAGTSYTAYKAPVIRDFMDETIRELFPDKLVEVTGSHLVHVAVNTLHGNMYVNLINAAGEHTNQSALGYDEVPPLQNLSVTIRTPEKPSGIFLQPGGKELEFSWADGLSTLLIAELPLHIILEVIP